jgi:4-amino-4-deoxy-L-arabinose transferase-like glycosyltransferase
MLEAHALDRFLKDRTLQLFSCLALALILRGSKFGDPNVHIDEAFYLLVGHQMHLGAVPYVDIWDRKPLGLFIAYWLFACFGDGVLAYQLAAWVFAAVTAFVLYLIAARWMSPLAAVIASILYLVGVGGLGGAGGQSPIFYNLFIASGALLVLQYVEGGKAWRLYAAMLLLGVAITFKQTAAFEAAFLGLWALRHHRDWRIAAIQIGIGLSPFAAIAGWYALAGHWPELYYAMVTANLAKAPSSLHAKALQIALMMVVIGPLIAVAVYSFRNSLEKSARLFTGAWLLAALVACAAPGNFFDHYALPALMPLAIIAAPACVRLPAGPILFMLSIAGPLGMTAPWDFAVHRESRHQFERMVHAIGPLRPGAHILIAEGPPLLYRATGAALMSPMVFPGHLTEGGEKDAWPVKTSAEIDRMLAMRPSAIIMRAERINGGNQETITQLLNYARANCRAPVLAKTFTLAHTEIEDLVFAGCSESPRPASTQSPVGDR